MNPDDQNSDLQPWIDPELEARIVAAVLGEASAFEQAELARLAAEKPELALFRRRLQAVHGLVGEASHPAKPHRLSADRRRRLLATLSGSAAMTPGVTVLSQSRPRWWRGSGMLRVAAGLMIGGIAAFFAANFLVPEKSASRAETAGILRGNEIAKDLEAPVTAAVSNSALFDSGSVPEAMAAAPMAEPLLAEKKVDGGGGFAFDEGSIVSRSKLSNFSNREEWEMPKEKQRPLDVISDKDSRADAAHAPAELGASDQPFSTFSLHVSDVSFQLAKDALARGERPDPTRIRPEEFYNAFDYGDPAPVAGESVACRIEQSASPLRPQRNLVRIAMKVASTGRSSSQPLRLTLLLDTSGSMEREDRAESVRRALAALASLLGPDDRVTLVGFARQPRLLAESLPGNKAAKLADIAARTPAEGGTNLEEALRLGTELAGKQQLATAQNRIVLLTDGAANLGDADPAALARRIGILRQQGIAFDAAGVGSDGLNDEILEALTRQGDGRYYLLPAAGDSPAAADTDFARQLAGAFRPAAQNVKVQVRWNPQRVGRYRLLGFEQHRLKTEDFRNDQVDAAELAAEEAGVALYEVEPLAEGDGELGEASVRFRDPATGQTIERKWTIPYDPQAPAFDRAPASLQLAGLSTALAEKLRAGPDAAGIDLPALAPLLTNVRSAYPHEFRVEELQQMWSQAPR